MLPLIANLYRSSARIGDIRPLQLCVDVCRGRGRTYFFRCSNLKDLYVCKSLPKREILGKADAQTSAYQSCRPKTVGDKNSIDDIRHGSSETLWPNQVISIVARIFLYVLAVNARRGFLLLVSLVCVNTAVFIEVLLPAVGGVNNLSRALLIVTILDCCI